ncbi:MAG: hypothetical protein SAL07_21370 [Oscillatoria sp. PMC 1051.18]|nr:hypothetical protein [Oscillatoria sp. PMC 1050.18]MEC5032457.1 hypothetical protein [Oscillatoria sp. PMC 1051.18]
MCQASPESEAIALGSRSTTFVLANFLKKDAQLKFFPKRKYATLANSI